MKWVIASGDGPHPPADSGIPPEAIRAQLEKILATELFAGSERLSRFLRFTVEQALEGCADQLKEYVLGLEVFDRKKSFDPRLESIVRVEAGRLRAKLKEYYETEGRDDPVRIDYGKGSYIPVFERQERPASPAWRRLLRYWKVAAVTAVLLLEVVTHRPASLFWRNLSRGEPGRPPPSSIAVLPFADLSPQKDQEYFSDGLTDELINRLSQVEGLLVLARTSSFQFKGKAQDIRKIGKELNVGGVLEGSVRKTGNRLRITAQLVDVADGFHLWSQTYEREITGSFEVQVEIAQAIVESLKFKVPGAAKPAVAK
jgi:adenylate cyclase